MCERATSTASGSAHVVTKEERLSSGLASVQAKLLTTASAARAAMPAAGKLSRGTGMLNWSYAVSCSGTIGFSSVVAIRGLLGLEEISDQGGCTTVTGLISAQPQGCAMCGTVRTPDRL